MLLPEASLVLLPSWNHYSNFNHCTLVLPVFEFYINGIIQKLHSIHAVLGDSFKLLQVAVYTCSLNLYSPIFSILKIHLSQSQFLAIMINFGTNITVLHFVGSIFRIGLLRYRVIYYCIIQQFVPFLLLNSIALL